MTTLNQSTIKKTGQQAFTLIELMIAMVIVGVTSAVGIPSIIETINEQKLSSQTNEIISALNVARSESVKQRKTITIRAITLDSVTSWKYGWQVFVDNNSNGTKDVGDTELKTVPPITDGSIAIASVNFLNFISYFPNGRANSLGNFTFCPADNIDSSRIIVIEGSGRMRSESNNYAANCP